MLNLVWKLKLSLKKVIDVDDLFLIFCFTWYQSVLLQFCSDVSSFLPLYNSFSFYWGTNFIPSSCWPKWILHICVYKHQALCSVSCISDILWDKGNRLLHTVTQKVHLTLCIARVCSVILLCSRSEGGRMRTSGWDVPVGFASSVPGGSNTKSEQNITGAVSHS